MATESERISVSAASEAVATPGDELMDHAQDEGASGNGEVLPREMVQSAITAPLLEGHVRYLVEFADSNVEFRRAEFDALANAFGFTYSAPKQDLRSTFLVLDSTCDPNLLCQVAQRAVMVRYVCLVWGVGATLEDCISDALKQRLCPLETYKTATFRFDFHRLGRKKLPKGRRTAMFKAIANFGFTGKIMLENPEYVHLLIEDYTPTGFAHPKLEGHHCASPHLVITGTRLCSSNRSELLDMLDLKVRNMIGNTSMDPELSIIQANMAQVMPGSLVLDPFCGTAGLLLPCAHFGGYVMGTDIAFQVIHGIGKTSRTNTGSKLRGPDENIRANFRQIGSSDKCVDTLVGDFAHLPWRDGLFLDAIVSDPPYGIREQTRKIGADKPSRGPIDPASATYFPKSQHYELGTLFTDLVQFAAEYLVVGGCLSFWIPELLDGNDFEFPSHPCLSVVAVSQQPLSSRYARRLVTMKKMRAPNKGECVVPIKPFSVRPVVFDPKKA
eukprot:m.40943 g.40943  ORF g.40943 m.40943 type:complete len:499 (-) comp10485_c0_seq2:129-1625(-)